MHPIIVKEAVKQIARVFEANRLGGIEVHQADIEVGHHLGEFTPGPQALAEAEVFPPH